MPSNSHWTNTSWDCNLAAAYGLRHRPPCPTVLHLHETLDKAWPHAVMVPRTTSCVPSRNTMLHPFRMGSLTTQGELAFKPVGTAGGRAMPAPTSSALARGGALELEAAPLAKATEAVAAAEVGTGADAEPDAAPSLDTCWRTFRGRFGRSIRSWPGSCCRGGGASASSSRSSNTRLMSIPSSWPLPRILVHIHFHCFRNDWQILRVNQAHNNIDDE